MKTIPRLAHRGTARAKALAWGAVSFIAACTSSKPGVPRAEEAVVSGECESVPVTAGACLHDGSGEALQYVSIRGTATLASRTDTDCPSGNSIGELSDRSMSFQRTRSTLTIDEGERTITVTLALPQEAPLIATGDVVSLHYEMKQGAWEPNDGSITLRDERGELLFWIAQSRTGFDSLGTPVELDARDGAEQCSKTDACGSWRRSSVIVESSTDRAELASGTADVGEYMALFGSNATSDHDNGPRECLVADGWWGHLVVVGAMRGERGALDAGAP